MGDNNGKIQNIAMKPKMTICIDVLQNNQVEIRGFPSNYNMAMEIMTVGIRRLHAYFVEQAKDGKIDDKGNLEKPMIQSVNQMPNKSRFPM